MGTNNGLMLSLTIFMYRLCFHNLIHEKDWKENQLYMLILHKNVNNNHLSIASTENINQLRIKTGYMLLV